MPTTDLVYSSDDEPGFSRRKCGRGFAYYDQHHDLIRDEEIRNRINELAIPPAYRDVWICPAERGHLQATGYDDRERKQYRYHPVWHELRNERKFDKLVDFARQLPTIRRRVQEDLSIGNGELTKEKVVAAAVRLIDHTGARIGNDSYTEKNGTHGVTTLEVNHLEEPEDDDHLVLHYRGKGSREVSFEIDSPAVARVVNRCSELPGQRLFQYEGENGSACTIRSHDVNEYLQDIADDVTAKDFRTWKATLLCFSELANQPVPAEESRRVEIVNEALKSTAGRLFHRPETCRKYYVHPIVIGTFLVGEPLEGATSLRKNRSPRRQHGEMEKALLRFLIQTS
ncbi:MAG: DNA topoisomerase IB [Verrucomicrobiales bacterium]|nr:DNA topoisomerase IB [Verrucomicrobiales bacterium]